VSAARRGHNSLDSRWQKRKVTRVQAGDEQPAFDAEAFLESAVWHGASCRSQETLSEMIGTTRSGVNFFMNRFRDLEFIEYNGDIRSSEVTAVGDRIDRA
jgi:hypothetical protein